MKPRFDYSNDTPVGEIAAAVPFADELFKYYRIDYCCGGSRKLGDVLKKGIFRRSNLSINWRRWP